MTSFEEFGISICKDYIRNKRFEKCVKCERCGECAFCGLDKYENKKRGLKECMIRGCYKEVCARCRRTSQECASCVFGESYEHDSRDINKVTWVTRCIECKKSKNKNIDVELVRKGYYPGLSL